MYFFLQFLQAYTDYTPIKTAIELLRSKTTFSTFYELFNVNENAPSEIISKRFRILMKVKEPIKGMSKERSKTFITDAFNILSRRRDDYDFFLMNDKFPSKTRVGLYFGISILLACLFVVDLLIMIYRNVKQKKMGKKEMKKNQRKGKSVDGIMFKEMYTVKIFTALKRKVIG